MSTGTPLAQQPSAPIRFRRSADQLTAGQQQTLRDGFSAMYAIDDDRGYGYFAGIHGLPLPISCENAHGSPYFLPWHRAYLYFFERALRDRLPDASLVWWDWQTSPSRDSRLPAPYLKAKAGGKANPLHSAKVPKLALDQARRIGWQVPGSTTKRQPLGQLGLPSQEEVEDVLARPQFIDFSRALEGLHGTVHGLGGRPHGNDPVCRL